MHQLAAERRLPPCMTLMYERLASEHHLKHYGLQQMSLFLKHIGLPLEQAVLFWRSMFSPRWGGYQFLGIISLIRLGAGLGLTILMLKRTGL